jgi:hypothetical protein
MLSAVIAMPALSESEHGDCFKEAPDTPIGNVARMVLAPLYKGSGQFRVKMHAKPQLLIFQIIRDA